jgi:DNA-binding NarL/FixJ family response regulator
VVGVLPHHPRCATGPTPPPPPPTPHDHGKAAAAFAAPVAAPIAGASHSLFCAPGEAVAVERVLIVDDHPLVRDGLRTVIAVAFDQTELFEAASIAEAAAIIDREGDFDLVMLDLNMPDAQGFSGLAALRERFPALPIVIVSGAVEAGLVQGAISNGAAGFIPKSLKRSAIVAAVQSILNGNLFVPDEFAAPDNAELEEIRHRIDSLTPQQRVVLGLVVAGKLNKQIAWELDVSMTTVKAHVSAILSKMSCYSRTQVVIMAGKVHFTPPERERTDN